MWTERPSLNVMNKEINEDELTMLCKYVEVLSVNNTCDFLVKRSVLLQVDTNARLQCLPTDGLTKSLSVLLN